MTVSVAAAFEEPEGRVSLSITGLSAGAQTVTVTRTSYRPHVSGTSARPYESADVRGWSGQAWTGTTLTVTDYEYDPSDGGTYWYTAYRVTTSLGGDASDTVMPVQTEWWLKSIQSPGSSLKARSAVSADLAAPPGGSAVRLMVSTLTPVKRSARVGVFPIVGSALPVVVTDVHPAGVFTMTILADDQVTASRCEDLLCAGDVLFSQPPAQVDAPGPVWAVVAGDVEVDRISGAAPDRMITVNDLTQVAPPPASVSALLWTYAGLTAAEVDYAAAATAYATYADLTEGPPPGTITA